MIHDATTVNKGRKDTKKNMDVRKPYAVVQYRKFTKGIDRADQYLSYFFSSEENCKMVIKKSGTVSTKLCSLQHIFNVQDTKYKQKSEVQELPA